MPSIRVKPALPAAAFVLALLLALLIAPAIAGAASGTPSLEPNDTLDTAFGPLAVGVTYSDAIETADDQDDYYFYVTNPNGAQVHVTLDDTVVDGDGVYVEIDDSSGNWIDYADVDGGGSVTLDEQLDPGKYFVSVQAETDDLVGETYDLSVDANADAIGSLDDVKTNCKNATSAASAAQTALSQAEKRLARARKSGSHRRKAQAHHAVKVARARLSDADAAMKAACAIPA